MNIFLELFRVLVYEPQLNILYLIFKLTGGEIGISFILMGVVVNLITLPLFIKSYITGQKNRILAPKLTEIREQYKKEPQVLMTKLREFNKKHGIENSSVLWILLVQIFFVSGLYYLIKDVADGKSISGLYSIFWGDQVTAVFKDGSKGLFAFGSLNVGDNSRDHLWLVAIPAVLSYFYGMYTFRWAPKPKIIEVKKPKPAKNSKDEPPLFDPVSFQKTMEIQQIYFIPLIFFFFNYSVLVGINIYFATTGALSLIRQIFLTNFYATHTENLINQIIDSDPTSKDDNPDNNLEITANADQMADNLPVAEKILQKDKTRNSLKLAQKPKIKYTKKRSKTKSN